MPARASSITEAKNHFEAFGFNAAQRMLNKVRQLPGDDGLVALRSAMDRISPTLYTRAEAYTTEARDAGHNASTALQIGVAKAMSESMLVELKQIGDKHIAKGGLGAVNRRFTAEGATGTHTTVQNTNQVTGIQVGPFIFGNSTKEQLIQVQGKYLAPRWQSADNLPAGIMMSLPTTSPDGTNWQAAIAEVLSHDCSFDGTSCFTSSMTDLGSTHRYGNLQDFIAGLPARGNKDFIGLKSGDGEGGDDANKEPDAPVIATVHPITGETWGVYMYIAVPYGGQPWGTSVNPTALLFNFRKVNDCGDFITASNVAEVAALTAVTGGVYGLLVSLGIVGRCYVWQFVKVVVAFIVDVVKTVVDDLVGLACTLVGTPGLPTTVTKAGVATKNPVATGVGVGMTVANSLCGNTTCLPGQSSINGVCTCPVGTELQNINGVMTCAPIQPWYSSPIAFVGIALAGLVGVLLLRDKKHKPATA